MSNNSTQCASPSRTPTIWVINRSAHDYSGAERFGTIRHMTEGSLNRYATNVIFRQLNEALRKSNPEDYILLTGLTVMSCIACAIFARKHYKLNLLIFRPNDNSYVARRLDLSDDVLNGGITE